MKHLALLCAVTLSVAHTPALCDLLVVPDDYPTINEAIYASGNSDTVLVRAGTYRENLYPSGLFLRLFSEDGPEATIVIGGLATGTFYGPFDIIIRGFTFRESWGIGTGSGQFADRIAIVNCVIEGNRNDCDGLWSGGGLSVVSVPWFGSVVVDSCVIRNNQGCRGGGVYLRGGEIRNSIVASNIATAGGGIYTDGFHRHRIVNCTVVGNEVQGPSRTTTGAGIEVHGGRVDLQRNIVAQNTGGVGIYVEDYLAPPEVSCTNAWGSGVANYAGFPDPTGTNGNISLDPQFCAPETGDYTVRASSPCAPENSPPGCGLIGSLPVGCGALGIVGQAVSTAVPELLVLPNPSSGAVGFRITGVPQDAVIGIYSSRGALVQVVSTRCSPISWLPGPEVSSGVYWARTQVGGQPVVARFILVR